MGFEFEKTLERLAAERIVKAVELSLDACANVWDERGGAHEDFKLHAEIKRLDGVDAPYASVGFAWLGSASRASCVVEQFLPMDVLKDRIVGAAMWCVTQAVNPR